MKVAAIQMDSLWENPSANLIKARQIVLSTDAELLVFPEMFATGFSMNPQRIAQKMAGEVVTRMTELAIESGKALIFSAAIEDAHSTAPNESHFYNRLFFIAPDGTRLVYDKRHLFRMANEQEFYAAGQNRLVIHYKDFRICPMVCYDLRFPVWSRQKGDYDLLIYIASWPEVRSYAWTTLLRARAIENQCYLMGVNRVGNDPKNLYSGDSVVVNFLGQPLVEATPSTEQVVSVELSLQELEQFRAGFPASMDADKFTIEQ
ncbi:MAG: nitrilase-related carbon-nitrogen hydrolase [Mucinivorans sp.]